METKELDNLSRTELFEVLKGKCKSIAKRDFYCWLICCCILVIPFFFTKIRLDCPKNIFLFSFLIVIVCLGGWLTLFSYRFLKKSDNFDSPNQLLSWFKKKHRFSMILWVVSCIGLIGTYFSAYGLNFEAYLGAGIVIVIIALVFYTGGPLWYLKEQHIIERLQELIEKK